MVRAQDVLGRMGGEEFLLVLPGATADAATDIIGRVRQNLPSARLVEDGINLAYTFSAGVAERRPGEERSSILRRADRALYAAKELTLRQNDSRSGGTSGRLEVLDDRLSRWSPEAH
jgi:diguanylate cyclase (GGDEF)-like protein